MQQLRASSFSSSDWRREALLIVLPDGKTLVSQPAINRNTHERKCSGKTRLAEKLFHRVRGLMQCLAGRPVLLGCIVTCISRDSAKSMETAAAHSQEDNSFLPQPSKEDSAKRPRPNPLSSKSYSPPSPNPGAPGPTENRTAPNSLLRTSFVEMGPMCEVP